MNPKDITISEKAEEEFIREAVREPRSRMLIIEATASGRCPGLCKSEVSIALARAILSQAPDGSEFLS